MAVCETWLVPAVSSSFVVIDGVQVLCSDCSQSVRKHGCCLYANDLLLLGSVDNGLMTASVVFLSDQDAYVLVTYRRPSKSQIQDENLLSFLALLQTQKRLFVVRALVK